MLHYTSAIGEGMVLKRFLWIAWLAACICTPSTAGEPQAAPEKEQILWQKLDAYIKETDQGLDGVMGVAILDLATGRTLLFHADEVLPTASSIKIAILAELYHQAQQGKLKLSEAYTLAQADIVGGSGIAGMFTPGVTGLTLRDLSVLMISVSDNSATNVIIDRLGMENVNGMLDSLGLRKIRLRRKMMDSNAAAEGRENVATPHEMTLLLEDLYRGKLLSGELSEEFFKVLSVHKESYITRGLPAEVRVASKPGELEGVRSDAGLVFTGKRPFVISVMTSYLRDERAGGQAITGIATAAYRMFERLSAASPYGRLLSPREAGRR